MVHLLWASLAIPVIIHLVYRRKATPMPFSTLEFLRMVDQRVARRQRLKELLLLCVRLLLLAALVGALEKPMLRASALGGAHVPTTVAIVLDNTHSMRAVHGGTTCFQRARAAATDILDGLTGEGARGEHSAVVLLFDSPDDVPPKPSTDLTRLRSWLGEMECGYGTGELSGPLRRALQSLEHSTNPRKEIYIITDMQKLCWSKALSEVAPSVPADVPLFLVDVGGNIGNNLALTKADFGLKVNVIGAPSNLFCTVTNTGPRGQQKELSFHLEGQKLDSRKVSLAPGGQLSAVFTHAFTEKRCYSGYVELSADELGPDNRRYFTTRIHEKVPVLVVNGSPSSIPFEDEVFYLNLALSARRSGQQSLSPVHTDIISEGEFFKRHLESYACVVLANVARLDERWAQRLRHYVIAGGGLVIFTGSQLDPASYNVALGAGDAGAGILPARLGALKSVGTGEDAFFHVRRVDVKHPVFRNIIDEIDLSAVQVSRLFAAEVAPDDGAATLIELDGGPLFIERRVGSGAVVLCTSSCTLEWNNLVLRPFFLPLIHEFVYYLGNAAGGEADVPVGMAYKLRVTETQDPVEVEFYGPAKEEGEQKPLAVVKSAVDGGLNAAVFSDTSEPGIYRARYRVGDEWREREFAVNVEPSESDLDRVSQEATEELLTVKDLTFVREPESLAQIVRRRREGLPLWDYLLLATIILAVGESFVANVLLKR